MIIRPIWSGM